MFVAPRMSPGWHRRSYVKCASALQTSTSGGALASLDRKRTVRYAPMIVIEQLSMRGQCQNFPHEQSAERCHSSTEIRWLGASEAVAGRFGRTHPRIQGLRLK